MSDIKKTAFIVLIVTLLFSNFSNFAYAANDYDHDALMQYDGYGKAMYESIVEQTTYVTGSYTDNKEYVSQSLDQVKDYANFWYDEYNDFYDSCNGTSFMNCLGEVGERGGAYVLTVGDWIKNLFNDYEQESTEGSSVIPDYESAYQGCFEKTGLYVNPRTANGCKVTAITPSGETVDLDNNKRFIVSFTDNWTTFEIDYVYPSRYYLDQYSTSGQAIEAGQKARESMNEIIHAGIRVGFTFIVTKNGQTLEPLSVVFPQRDFTKYVQENDVSVPLPQLKPQLVCPDGTKIQMSISGSTFLAADGTTMIVNQDGTAQVNSQLCNLNWEKPIIKYNEEGTPVIETDQGERDLTTGEIVEGTAPACEGVLCFLSNILDSIVGLVGKLLDGILALFVPDDLSFISEEFARITDSLTQKISITEDLKDMLTGIFVEGASNPLTEIVIDLPILDKPLKFGEVSFINEGVPTLRKVISAIVILYTLLYVYRKITGRGGVMER